MFDVLIQPLTPSQMVVIIVIAVCFAVGSVVMAIAATRLYADLATEEARADLAEKDAAERRSALSSITARLEHAEKLEKRAASACDEYKASEAERRRQFGLLNIDHVQLKQKYDALLVAYEALLAAQNTRDKAGRFKCKVALPAAKP